MPSYAQVLLLCAGLATAAPAPRHVKDGRIFDLFRTASTTSVQDTTTSATPVASVVDIPVVSTAPTSTDLPVVSTTPTTSDISAQAAVATAYAPVASGSVWKPTAGMSWQIILNTKLDASKALTPDVQVFDIDMAGNDASTMAQLKAKGKHVICYFSAGSYEPYRDDSNLFQPADMGLVMDGWPDEKWLDIRSTNVRNIMTKRIQLAKQKGCDAVDPDNVDGYNNANGLGLTEDDAYNYMAFLAKVAADNNLAIGLKNAGALVPRVIDLMHFSVNEQCHQYNECKSFQPFIAQNKPVFNIEYPSETYSTVATVQVQACSATSSGDSQGFSTVIKNLSLDGWVSMCDATAATTATTSY